MKYIFLVFLLASFVYAETKKMITVEDFLQTPYPRNMAVSPDEGRIAFTQIHPDFQKSEWQHRLYWLETASGTVRQLVYDNYNCYQPAWSPDGKYLSFVSNRPAGNSEPTDQERLWLLPAGGGEAFSLTSLPGGILQYRWQQDAKAVFVLSEETDDSISAARRERRLQQKFDEIVKDSISYRKVIYRISVPEGQVRQIAVLDPGVDEFDLSADGRKIVYQTNYTGAFDDAQKYDLWLLETTTGNTRQLTRMAGPETHPKFSPDGSQIAFITQTTPDVEFAETDISLLSLNATEEAETLTENFNLSVLDFVWDKKEKKIFLRIAEGLETHVYQLWLKKGRIGKISNTPGNILELQVVNKNLWVRFEDENHLPEFGKIEKKGKIKLVSQFSEPLSQFDMGVQKRYRWKSIDDEEIEGLLFLPSDFDPNQKYPLILAVHGGPYGRVRLAVRQSNYKQIFAADGYVVLAPNPRGSSGYNDDFGKAIWYKYGGHMGGIDYHDIMSGVNTLIQEGFIDETRMGVIGGSYGGYLTNWILSQTDRFAAAVSQFGIFSFFTDWSNSWQPAFEKMYFGIYYWERPVSPNHPYVAYSPAFHVEKIKTPVLILHGERDRYTNLANSQEMYQALKTLGRTVKFVVYPRENHGMSREPNHRRNVIHRAKKWLDSYLKK